MRRIFVEVHVTGHLVFVPSLDSHRVCLGCAYLQNGAEHVVRLFVARSKFLLEVRIFFRKWKVLQKA